MSTTTSLPIGDGIAVVLPGAPLTPVRDRVAFYRIIVAAGILAAWQGVSGRLVNPFWMSSPLEIGTTLWAWTRSGLLERHLLVTFQETAVGFLIGSVTAIAAALAIGRSDTARRTIDPFSTAVYGVPKVALPRCSSCGSASA